MHMAHMFLEANPKRPFFGNDLFWVGNRAVHDFIKLRLTNNGLKQLAPAATQNVIAFRFYFG
jgi:hypothetical protein